MKLFDYETTHLQQLRSILPECTVLLKSDGSFPLSSPCRIAAYGLGVRHTVKGGTGSGEVNSRFFVTIEEGLKQQGFTITTGKWLDELDHRLIDAKKEFIAGIKARAKSEKQNVLMYSMGKVMPSPEYDIPLDYNCDAAIYVVSRNSGEGGDREFIAGDIKLSESEIRDIKMLDSKVRSFMLVLNVGGVVDLSPVSDVRNILVLSQLGVETGTTLANLLSGKTYPSGKLATTWAACDEYYAMKDFEDMDETRYTEGIYVGYRYFDSFGKKPLFPFGYGLGYTKFSIKTADVSHDRDSITVRTTVKNIGEHCGKEVVQLYLSAPSLKLDKPYQELCGFAKTPELSPGSSEDISITFKMSDCASYDSDSQSYILEHGDYYLRVGNSSRETTVAAVIHLDETVITLKAKNVFGKTDFQDMACTGSDSHVKADLSNTVKINLSAADFHTVVPQYDKDYPVSPEISSLTDDELCYMNIGAFDPKESGLTGVVGSSNFTVCGAGGESTRLVKNFPHLVMADGPAGLRLAKEYYRDAAGVHTIGNTAIPSSMMVFFPKPMLFLMNLSASRPKKGTEILYQYCTAIPIGTAIAQSFNQDAAIVCGDVVGAEMERFGVHLWLAPALNIHRSIQCGRNFEYYSEDPLVSGKIAAGITRGVQAHKGCGTTIKHYAANNKEKNRYCNNSIVSERAMREIYTKGFGICIRESSPKSVMTSYNLINGTHTAEHRGLIEDILRSEYGFEGIVMTDWVMSMSVDKRSKYRNSLPANSAAAGGDLFMPGCKEDFDNMKKGLVMGTVTRRQLEINATRILGMSHMLNQCSGIN